MLARRSLKEEPRPYEAEYNEDEFEEGEYEELDDKLQDEEEWRKLVGKLDLLESSESLPESKGRRPSEANSTIAI